MKMKYKIETVDGNDYVSVTDAKKILGAKSANDIRALGSATITVGKNRTLWSLGWLIEKAKHLRDSKKLDPDYAWIDEYTIEATADKKRSSKQQVVSVAASTRGGGSQSQKSDLSELRQLLPPPEEVPGKDVDWKAIETAVGVAYPASFKAFIKTYGALQWFDWLQPLVPFDKMTPKSFEAYLEGVFRDTLGGNIVDSNGSPLTVPKFGDLGGWLPFMMGSDGEVYAWQTDGPAESWNVACVINRHAQVLQPISIAEMLAGWLAGEPTMEPIWGSVEEFRKHSPKRLTMLR